MITRLVTYIVFCLFLSAGSAYAILGFGDDENASQKQKKQMSFEKLDADRDMNISKEEFEKGGLQESYDAYDVDNDGVISQREYRGVQGIQRGKIKEMGFKEIDLDGDQNIDRKEFSHIGKSQDEFDQFDVDQDGVLGQQEFNKARNLLREDVQADQGGDDATIQKERSFEEKDMKQKKQPADKEIESIEKEKSGQLEKENEAEAYGTKDLSGVEGESEMKDVEQGEPSIQRKGQENMTDQQSARDKEMSGEGKYEYERYHGTDTEQNLQHDEQVESGKSELEAERTDQPESQKENVPHQSEKKDLVYPSGKEDAQ